jgi:hypothetical protein
MHCSALTTRQDIINQKNNYSHSTSSEGKSVTLLTCSKSKRGRYNVYPTEAGISPPSYNFQHTPTSWNYNDPKAPARAENKSESRVLRCHTSAPKAHSLAFGDHRPLPGSHKTKQSPNRPQGQLSALQILHKRALQHYLRNSVILIMKRRLPEENPTHIKRWGKHKLMAACWSTVP